MPDGAIDTTTPNSATQTFAQIWASLRANLAQIAIHIADAVDAHGLAGVLPVIAEAVYARGSRSSLDQRLSMSLNPDGTLRSAITQTSLSEWTDSSFAPVRVDAYTFTVPGNHTDILLPLRRVKITDATTSYLSMIQSSTYNSGPNTTTVVVYDGVVPASPVDLFYGFVTPGGSGSLDLRAITPTWLDQYNARGF